MILEDFLQKQFFPTKRLEMLYIQIYIPESEESELSEEYPAINDKAMLQFHSIIYFHLHLKFSF